MISCVRIYVILFQVTDCDVIRIACRRQGRDLRPVVGIGLSTVHKVSHLIAHRKIDRDLAVEELVIRVRRLGLLNVEGRIVLPVTAGHTCIHVRHNGIDGIDAVINRHCLDSVCNLFARRIFLINLKARPVDQLPIVVDLPELHCLPEHIDDVVVIAGLGTRRRAGLAKSPQTSVVGYLAVALLVGRQVFIIRREGHLKSVPLYGGADNIRRVTLIRIAKNLINNSLHQLDVDRAGIVAVVDRVGVAVILRINIVSEGYTGIFLSIQF